MPGIFICYRREDTAGWAGRLCADLKAGLRGTAVFMDIDAIPPGVPYDTYIAQAVGSCDVLIALVGPRWLTATDKNGRRRLDDPRDLTRLEILAALRRNIRVIPALVGGAQVPAEDELPAELRPLARRQSYELADHRWTADCDSLVQALKPLVRPSRSTPRNVVAGLGVALLLVLGGYGVKTWLGWRAGSGATAPATVVEATPSPSPTASVTPTPTPSETPPPGEQTTLPIGVTPGPVNVVEVPDLSGQSLDAARDTLRLAGLRLVVAGYRPTQTSPPDVVVGQAPAAGEKTEPGSQVNAWVTSASQLRVPELRKMWLSAARAKLDRSGLKLGRVTSGELIERDWKEPMVVSQSPVTDSFVNHGDAIDLVVVEPGVRVPDLGKRTLDEARELISKAGLELRVGSREPWDRPTILVIGQSPRPKTLAHPGETVTVTVVWPRKGSPEAARPQLGQGCPSGRCDTGLVCANGICLGDVKHDCSSGKECASGRCYKGACGA